MGYCRESERSIQNPPLGITICAIRIRTDYFINGFALEAPNERAPPNQELIALR